MQSDVMAAAPPSIDPQKYRRVMGHLPTGVVVVTALAEDGQPVGMSVGSCTSVSLDPPLIAFLPAASSTTWPKMAGAKCFCVNILCSEQEQLCRTFAAKGIDKFAGLRWRSAGSSAPIIEGSLAWVDCDLERIDEAGDHYIVLGRVREMEIEQPSVPLVFFQGGYGRFDAGSGVAGDRSGDLAEHLRDADVARAEMEAIAFRLDAECVVGAQVGDELVMIAGGGPMHRRHSGMLIGGRIPAIPPASATSMAWETPERVAAWLARAPSPAARAAAEARTAQVRRKGYAVSLGIGLREWAEIFANPRLQDPAVLRAEMPELMKQIADPPEIGPEDARRVLSIHMPVFGPDGRVALTFNLGSFESVDLDRLNEMIARLRESADRVTAMLGGSRPA
jgi:flavin reductase (DIM6/NTAB) family NADH-FMN oxidoreductase RutF/DNA-binding IclR family transcriptional regulator